MLDLLSCLDEIKELRDQGCPYDTEEDRNFTNKIKNVWHNSIHTKAIDDNVIQRINLILAGMKKRVRIDYLFGSRDSWE